MEIKNNNNQYVATFGSYHLKDYNVIPIETIVIVEAKDEDSARDLLIDSIGIDFCTTYPIDMLTYLQDKYKLKVYTLDELKVLHKYYNYDYVLENDVLFLNDTYNEQFVAVTDESIYMHAGTRLMKEGSHYKSTSGLVIADTIPIVEYKNSQFDLGENYESGNL